MPTIFANCLSLYKCLSEWVRAGVALLKRRKQQQRGPDGQGETTSASWNKIIHCTTTDVSVDVYQKVSPPLIHIYHLFTLKSDPFSSRQTNVSSPCDSVTETAETGGHSPIWTSFHNASPDWLEQNIPKIKTSPYHLTLILEQMQKPTWQQQEEK